MYSGPSAPDDRQPSQINCEEPNHDWGEGEGRKRDSPEADHAQNMVLPLAAMARRGDAGGQRKYDGKQDGGEGQRGGIGIPLQDELGDRAIEAHRLAEVQMHARRASSADTAHPVAGRAHRRAGGRRHLREARPHPASAGPDRRARGGSAGRRATRRARALAAPATASARCSIAAVSNSRATILWSGGAIEIRRLKGEVGLRRHGLDSHAADPFSVHLDHGKLAAFKFKRLSAAGDSAEVTQDKSCERFHSAVAGQAQSCLGLEVVNIQAAIEQQRTRRNAERGPRNRIELIGNLAHDLLERVLYRDEPAGGAELVYHDGEVPPQLLELLQQASRRTLTPAPRPRRA